MQDELDCSETSTYFLTFGITFVTIGQVSKARQRSNEITVQQNLYF